MQDTKSAEVSLFKFKLTDRKSYKLEMMASKETPREDPNLAPGWVKMEDQYGEYYINLYNKQTSRIKPVRANVYQQSALPPPPEAPDDDEDDNKLQQQQQQQAISPMIAQSPISPRSYQQQMFNQQLYQQQYAQQYQQQMMYQQQMQGYNSQYASPQMQQYPNYANNHYQQQLYAQQQAMNPNQMNYQPQPQQPYAQQQQQQIQQQNEEEEEEDEDEQSSSASTKSSSVGTASDNEEEEQEEEEEEDNHQRMDTFVEKGSQSKIASIQPQSQIVAQDQIIQNGPAQRSHSNSLTVQKQQILPQNVQNELQRRISKENPSTSNQNDSKVQKMESINQQYRFQPIRPPSASVSVDNNNISISPINGPSPAFSAQKMQNLADAADFAQLPQQNPLMEGNSNSNVSLELASKSEVAAPAPAPAIDKQGSTIFGVLLQQKDKSNHLARQDNWDMLVEGIEQNCPIPDQYDVFKAMRKVARNLLLGDEKFRTLYADNDMVQKKILGRVGGYEFLRGIGFKQGMDDNELVVTQIDQHAINLAINSLQKRITVLKERKKMWGKQNNNANAQNNQADEEQRQLEEALKLSQQQHIKDMLQRQQKELDMAKRANAFKKAQSVKIYSPVEEDDQKNNFLYEL